MSQKERVDKYQALLETVRQDNQNLEQFLSQFREAQDRINQLGQYYHTDWMQDYEEVKESVEVLNQDAIYEELIKQYQLLIKLNLEIASILAGGNQ